MRKIVLQLAVSLDGFIEGPNGEYDWCFTDQDYGLSHFLQRVDTAFMGRKTYELVQSMDSKESGLPKLNQFVFSNTLRYVEGATLIQGAIKPTVEKLKSEPGKDIWLFGGAGLTASLLNLDLVDEVSLAIHPLLLGGGTPLFNPIKERKHLTLLTTKTYDTGLITVTYAIQKK